MFNPYYRDLYYGTVNGPFYGMDPDFFGADGTFDNKTTDPRTGKPYTRQQLEARAREERSRKQRDDEIARSNSRKYAAQKEASHEAEMAALEKESISMLDNASLIRYEKILQSELENPKNSYQKHIISAKLLKVAEELKRRNLSGWQKTVAKVGNWWDDVKAKFKSSGEFDDFADYMDTALANATACGDFGAAGSFQQRRSRSRSVGKRKKRVVRRRRRSAKRAPSKRATASKKRRSRSSSMRRAPNKKRRVVLRRRKVHRRHR